MSSSM